MPGIVVDASVFGAIAFNEPQKPNAESLIADRQVYAPRILAFEITNVARTKVVSSPFDRQVIFNGLGAALRSDISWTEVDFRKILELALETSLTAYDASYLYLSQTLGLPLATFDRKLSAAAHSRGIR